MPLGAACTGFEISQKSITTAIYVDTALQHPKQCIFKSKMSRLGCNMAPTWAQQTSVLVPCWGSKLMLGPRCSQLGHQRPLDRPKYPLEPSNMIPRTTKIAKPLIKSLVRYDMRCIQHDVQATDRNPSVWAGGMRRKPVKFHGYSFPDVKRSNFLYI